ncbi:hypothetical protein AVEN_147730-1 [Araneus ventricosus]|uniref:Uncharacterized protein n=1 Tax=Araneus ventricosus TaxID=182803 RepID=A0A4Y2ML85_ARAVE|nr:hypothetical protein AVEN_147730-1 [Araneus ventricosus]
MNAVSIPGSEELEVLSPSCIEIVQIMRLEMAKYDIDEIEEGHNQELTTEELMEFHCASQQEVVKESLREVLSAKR